MDIRVEITNIGKRDLNVMQVDVSPRHLDKAFEQIRKSIKRKIGCDFSTVLGKIKALEYNFKENNYNNLDKLIVGKEAFKSIKDSIHNSCMAIPFHNFGGSIFLMGYPVEIDEKADDWYVGFQVSANND